MKQLRVLTGAHAGAQLRLSRDSCVLGAGADADIEITDWTHAPILLELRDGEPVRVQVLAGDEPREGTPLADLAPQRFDDIVLCVGEADAAWPSDIRLLEKMVKEPPPPPAREKHRQHLPPRMMVAGGVACVALLLAFAGVISHSGKAAASVPERPLAVRVSRAIEATGVTGVQALVTGDGGVTVEGMVIDGSSAAKLRTALQPFSAERVGHHYSAATDIAQAISDALANPGLQVRYDAAGVFRVTGASVHLDGVREKLQRVATDLGPVVSRIDVVAADLPPPSTLPAGAVLSAGTLEYVQTRDGTKHMVLITPPEEPASAALPAVRTRPLRHAPKRFASLQGARHGPP